MQEIRILGLQDKIFKIFHNSAPSRRWVKSHWPFIIINGLHSTKNDMNMVNQAGRLSLPMFVQAKGAHLQTFPGNLKMSCSLQNPMLMSTNTSSPGRSVFVKESRMNKLLLYHIKYIKSDLRLIDHGFRLHNALVSDDTSILEVTPEHLDGLSLERWQACFTYIVALGLTDEEAAKVLGKAFGHIRSPYWGQNKEKAVPEPSIPLEIIDYLRNLGLNDIDLGEVLKKFPEILGCDLEDLEKNVADLDSKWDITGRTLKNLILRKPHVLGYNVDCGGDCMAECTRCWARF